MPKSPFAALPTKVANCSTKPRSRPSLARSSSRCAWLACSFSISSTGSPTNLKVMKAMKATASMTPAALAMRLIRKISIAVSLGVYARRERGCAASPPRSRCSLHPCQPQARLVVGSLHRALDARAHSPGHGLLVQRDGERLFLDDLQRLGHQRNALRRIELDAGLVGELVDARIAPAPPVEHAARAALRVQHLDQHRIGIDHRLIGPAEGDQVEIPFDALRRLLAARRHVEIGLQPGAGPHGGDGLTELLLVDERVGVTVHVEGEAIGIAGLGKLFLCGV